MYEKQIWKDLPSEETPFSAARMTHIEDGIYDIYNNLFPVNSVKIFYDADDHSNYLGFTWVRTALHRFPVGYDASDNDYNEIGKKGGEKTHTLTINEIPSHNHRGIHWNRDDVSLTVTGTDGNITCLDLAYSSKNFNQQSADSIYTNLTGGNQPHNNTPEYEVFAFWRRTM